MTRIPGQVSVLLNDLVHRLPVLLGRDLVGVYVYGSLTQRAFNPERSDVDCLVVTRRALSEAQFKRLGAWLARKAESNPWTKRLQMSFLLRDELLTLNSKACLDQFGHLSRSNSDGNPIIWMNVLKSGIVLYGPRPQSFVPQITREILYQALEREVGYLRQEIIEKPHSEWRNVPFYRAYAVLTLCRILYTLRKGTIGSKPRAAKWAIKELPREWSEIITRAILSDAGQARRHIPLSRIRQFIEFTDAQLHSVDTKARR